MASMTMKKGNGCFTVFNSHEKRADETEQKWLYVFCNLVKNRYVFARRDWLLLFFFINQLQKTISFKLFFRPKPRLLRTLILWNCLIFYYPKHEQRDDFEELINGERLGKNKIILFSEFLLENFFFLINNW